MIANTKEEFIQKLLEIITETSINIVDINFTSSFQLPDYENAYILVDGKERETYQLLPSDIAGFSFETGRIAFYTRKFRIKSKSDEEEGRFSFDFIIDDDECLDFEFCSGEDYDVSNRKIYFGKFLKRRLERVDLMQSGSLTKRAL